VEQISGEPETESIMFQKIKCNSFVLRTVFKGFQRTAADPLKAPTRQLPRPERR
jgi:hypothetical protein